MNWVKIFSSGDEMRTKLQASVPRLLVVGDRQICLVMWKDELRAIENRCPHNGDSLSKGKVNYLGEIVCPWHGYRFHLATGRECNERCGDLETYPVKENEGGVFVGL